MIQLPKVSEKRVNEYLENVKDDYKKGIGKSKGS